MREYPLFMKAVVTSGNGGYDQLEYKEVPVPPLVPGTLLVQVLAAGVNNTEINTRLGWYSSKVTKGTQSLSTDASEKAVVSAIADGGWNTPTPFPLIQGTDCCGRVYAVGDAQQKYLVGKRVLIRPCMRVCGWDSLENIWMGSDFNGAFAQFVRVPVQEVFAVDCSWTDAELGTIPCAYGTAQNMIHRARVSKGDVVLINGASGGVGSAAVQLASRRGAFIVAITSSAKKDRVQAIGAHKVVTRDEDLLQALGERSVDVVIDNVAGPGFGCMFKALKPGGRLVTSGAIAGPLVEADLRDIYLKDLTLIGCTAWDEPVFPEVVSAIERGEISPLLVATFSLEKIVEAQQLFSQKNHVGKIVLLP